MVGSIKITYDLKPPSGTQENKLSTSKSHEFVIPESAQGSNRAYYAALQATIAKAKDEVGNELTAWRDAVGKAELTKEAKGAINSEDDEDEDENDP